MRRVMGIATIYQKCKNVEVIYLPPRTTSRIQPLDAGVIACIKRGYRCSQLERAVRLIDSREVNNTYSLDLYTAKTLTYEIWFGLDCRSIHNCWLKQVSLTKSNKDRSVTFGVILLLIRYTYIMQPNFPYTPSYSILYRL